MTRSIILALTCISFMSCHNSGNNTRITIDTTKALKSKTLMVDSTKSNIQLMEEYTKLANKGEWQKALPIIEQIVQENTKLSTSWFNYGVCLEALNQYEKSAKSFITAYELDPEDYGAQYRIYRSLSLAKDTAGFVDFLTRDIRVVPEIRELLMDEPEFKSMISSPQVKKILNKTH